MSELLELSVTFLVAVAAYVLAFTGDAVRTLIHSIADHRTAQAQSVLRHAGLLHLEGEDIE